LPPLIFGRRRGERALRLLLRLRSLAAPLPDLGKLEPQRPQLLPRPVQVLQDRHVLGHGEDRVPAFDPGDAPPDLACAGIGAADELGEAADSVAAPDHLDPRDDGRLFALEQLQAEGPAELLRDTIGVAPHDPQSEAAPRNAGAAGGGDLLPDLRQAPLQRVHFQPVQPLGRGARQVALAPHALLQQSVLRLQRRDLALQSRDRPIRLVRLRQHHQGDEDDQEDQQVSSDPPHQPAEQNGHAGYSPSAGAAAAEPGLVLCKISAGTARSPVQHPARRTTGAGAVRS
jgi:hypothetical protein